MFLTPHPTAWTLGFIVPAHTRDMKLMYGLGLGLSSMEGREAKHISICKYSKNTNYKKRSEQIFLHEHVSLVWLRKRGYNRKSLLVHATCDTYQSMQPMIQVFAIVGWKKRFCLV